MYIDFIHTIFTILENQGAKELRGFDIGFGTNFIYPILGIQKYGWEITGSEINEESMEWV